VTEGGGELAPALAPGQAGPVTCGGRRETPASLPPAPCSAAPSIPANDLSGAEPARAGLRLRNTQLTGVEGFPTDGGFYPSHVAPSTNTARLSRTSPRDVYAPDRARGLL
jgi:hypothetical protein